MADLPMSTKQLAFELKVDPRQVVVWAEANLLPILRDDVGRGNSRLYSHESLERGRLLCKLKKANISVRDIRNLLPIIENALADETTLSVPYPIKVGKHLFTMCYLPLHGPVLIEGIPPGQTVISLMVLSELNPEERKEIGKDK